MRQLLLPLVALAATARAQGPPPGGGGAERTVRLANGVRLPLVSLGTGDPPNQTRTNLEAALGKGFRAVDTALIYFDQSGVAEAIADEVGKCECKRLFSPGACCSTAASES
eukprot:COSAG04_NODE_447_length_14267_cov_17.958569_9_plen_111_part_00